MPHRPAYHHSLSNHPTYPASTRSRPVAAAPGRRAEGYTFAHAGRQIRLGPIAFWIVVGTLVIMAAWSITTATYFAFREDVLTQLVSREADMQFGYEDRIAELRAQIDRLSSRQLLDQEQYDQRLDQLQRRQATLESRAAALGGLPDQTSTGSIKPPPRSLGTLPRAPPKLSPTGDATPFLPPASPGGFHLASVPNDGVEGALYRLQASLDRIDARERTQLNIAEETYHARAQRMRGVFADLGINPGRVPPAKGAESGLGGPFVAAVPLADTGSFDRQFHNVSIARAQVEQLARALANIPLRKPIAGETEIVSGFGVRIDPFLSRPAMHTGLDFRAEIGDPIHATANGTVTIAGWTGGYGKMVEIDHGNGLATRYGHMSEIDVKVGQQIKSGQVIGKVGTSGRSTGPHLHYETRINGEPVDPLRFLNAGTKVADAL